MVQKPKCRDSWNSISPESMAPRRLGYVKPAIILTASFCPAISDVPYPQTNFADFLSPLRLRGFDAWLQNLQRADAAFLCSGLYLVGPLEFVDEAICKLPGSRF